MHIFSKLPIFVLTLLVSITLAQTACSSSYQNNNARSTTRSGLQSLTFEKREFLLYTPRSTRSNAKLPLLIVLHGGLGNATEVSKKLAIESYAQRKGMMVAFLNGTEGFRRTMKDRRTWNAGECCGVAQKRDIDDMGYIRHFITMMTQKYNVDAQNISLMGHSNGAMMSYRFVCEAPGIIKNLVAVSAPLLSNQCNAHNMHVLHIHGDADPHVPYEGGRGAKSLTDVDYPSVAQTKAIVAKDNVTFETILLRNTGHNIPEVNQGMRQQYHQTLAEKAVEFVTKK